MEYTLTDDEQRALAEFRDAHRDAHFTRYRRTCSSYGRDADVCDLTFKHGSGVGVGVEATCTVCGLTEDITDYGSW
jgi:hypothetical protein